MLIKPTIDSFKVINAEKANVISFMVSGGDQFVSFTYEIHNNVTAALVKMEKIYSQTPSFGVATQTLSNGVEYKVRVKTHDIADSESTYSDYMILKCHSDGTTRITNLDLSGGIHFIRNQQFTFNGLFTQGEGVKLKSYRYYIYDENRNLIKEYPLVYQQTGTLSQLTAGFNNATYYFVELRCYDQYDRMVTSGFVQCYVIYKPADLRQVINLTNDRENASIKIESDIRQLIFRVHGDWKWDTNSHINLTQANAMAYLDNAFTIGSDFTMQAWLRNMNKDKVLIQLKDVTNGDDIIITYQTDNRFHAYRTVGTMASHYVSPVINATSECTLWVRQVGRRIEMKCGVI